VPSLVRAWRAGGATDGVDWSAIRVFSSTGEASTAEEYRWLLALAGDRAPMIEYCGGTELGGGYVTGTVVQPCAPATFTTPALGLGLVLLDEQGRPVPDGTAGEVFLVPPSIGLSQRLLNRDHEAVYHEGCPHGPDGQLLRRHGDRLVRLPGGFWKAQGRADDALNLGGIKVDSVELERVLDGHPAVHEAAAVGFSEGGEGVERLAVFAVLADPDADREALRGELDRRLADELNPLFRTARLELVDRLPRTASGKVMRRELRSRLG